jgi:hypothetical protein
MLVKDFKKLTDIPVLLNIFYNILFVRRQGMIGASSSNSYPAYYITQRKRCEKEFCMNS